MTEPNEKTDAGPNSHGGDASDDNESIGPYPLRRRAEDPQWAVRTMWTWIGIAIFLMAFILVLLTLGWWYD